MKLFSVFAVLSLTMLMGCFPTASNVTPSYGMTAAIGTTQFNASAVTAYFSMNILAITAHTVTAGVPGQPEINLSIPNWTGVAGTFTMTPLSGGGGTITGPFGQYIPSASSLTSVSQSGSIIINSVTTSTIIGTFSFTCSDGTNVTVGNFVAKRY